MKRSYFSTVVASLFLLCLVVVGITVYRNEPGLPSLPSFSSLPSVTSLSDVFFPSLGTQLAQVAGTPKVITLTSGTTWTVPADWNSANNTIEAYGGGGGGGSTYWNSGGGGGSTAFGTYVVATGGAGGGSSAGCAGGQGGQTTGGGKGDSGDCQGAGGSGGGGGAYAKVTNVALTANATVNIAIGMGGGGGSYGAAGAGGSGYFSGGTGTGYAGGGGAGSSGNGGNPSGNNGGIAGTGGSIGSTVQAGGNGTVGTVATTIPGGNAGGPAGGSGGTNQTVGNIPGGGGGGVNATQVSSGAAGAQGEIIITYTPVIGGTGGGGGGTGGGNPPATTTPPVTQPPSQCAAPAATAGTYYVTPLGAGCKNGSDWNNAFAGLPASSLIRGSTYYMASGNYGSYLFNTPESGTSVISIVKATSGNAGGVAGWQSGYGSGQAVFGSTLSTQTWYWHFYGTVFSTGYWTFDGSTSGGASPSGYGFTFLPNPIPSNGEDYIDFDAAEQNTFKGITVRNTSITCSSQQNNPEYGINAGTTADVEGPSFQYDYISGCNVAVNIFGNNWLIEHSYLLNDWSASAHHGVMVDVQNTYNVANSDNSTIFRYNTVQGCTYSCIESNGSGPTMTGWRIYGNIFDQRSNGTDGIISSAGGSTILNTLIYNNTFISPSMALLWSQDPGGPGAAYTSGDVVENNLIYNAQGNFSLFNANGGAAITHDHNAYWSSNWAGQLTDTVLSDQTVATGNPFVSLSGQNYHLASATAAGLSLASPYNVDADGTIRGANGVWSMGAYQYTGGVTSPSTYTLTVSGGGGAAGGTVTGGSINCGATCTQSNITSGTNITLTATPASGYTLSSWSGCTSSSGTICSITVTSNTTVTAAFSATVTPPPPSAPVVSSLMSFVTPNSATITWTTSPAATTQVFYGLTSALGNQSALNAALTASHNVVLTGLTANTLYHYAAVSSANGVSATSTATFTTSFAPDTTPPTVSITSPSGTISTTVTLSVNASDPTVTGQITSGISTVQFKLDGVNLGSPLTTAPYSGSWNTSGVSNGSHTLTAVATDIAGNTATSVSRVITVNNVVVPPPATTTPIIPPTSTTTTGTGSGSTGSTGSGSSGGSSTGGSSTSGAPSAPSSTTGTSVGTFTPTVPQAPIKVSTPVIISTAASIPSNLLALPLGSTGANVVSLQDSLISLGYLAPGLNTGYYGSLTAAAVAKYKAGISMSTTVAAPTTTLTPASLSSIPPFTRNLSLGSTGTDVKYLQIFLNDEGYIVASSGNGSKGHETTYFGPATKAAVIKFQNAYATQILKPYGLTKGTGLVGAATRKEINSII